MARLWRTLRNEPCVLYFMERVTYHTLVLINHYPNTNKSWLILTIRSNHSLVFLTNPSTNQFQGTSSMTSISFILPLDYNLQTFLQLNQSWSTGDYHTIYTPHIQPYIYIYICTIVYTHIYIYHTICTIYSTTAYRSIVYIDTLTTHACMLYVCICTL